MTGAAGSSGERGLKSAPARPRRVPLTRREKAVAIVAGGIAAYSLRSSGGSLPAGTSLADFVMRAVPRDVRADVTAELIDDVFACVSGAHGS